MHAREIRHGYGHDSESQSIHEAHGALAFHVRRHRHGYGKSGISQRALAMIAHLSRRVVEEMEASSDLRGSAESLLRVALALRLPVEEIVSPDRLELLRKEIERRRSLLGGDAALPPEAPAPAKPRCHLAVAYRSPFLLMAISDGKRILDLQQQRAAPVQTCLRFRSLIEEEARTSSVSEIIVEVDTKTSDYVYSIGMPHRTLSFRRAKQFLSGTGDGPPPTDTRFFQALVEGHPELRRYVRVLPATGRVAVTERWRTARLTVASLALAAPAASQALPPKTITGTPPGAKPKSPPAAR